MFSKTCALPQPPSSPNPFTWKWGDHLLIVWSLSICIYKAASEFNRLLHVCSIDWSPNNAVTNRKGLGFFLDCIWINMSIVNTCEFVSHHSPEPYSTCFIFLAGVVSSNLSLLFKPRTISSLSMSSLCFERDDLFSWGLLFLGCLSTSIPYFRFEHTRVVGSEEYNFTDKTTADI